jgi:hypothetical protein
VQGPLRELKPLLLALPISMAGLAGALYGCKTANVERRSRGSWALMCGHCTLSSAGSFGGWALQRKGMGAAAAGERDIAQALRSGCLIVEGWCFAH